MASAWLGQRQVSVSPSMRCSAVLGTPASMAIVAQFSRLPRMVSKKWPSTTWADGRIGLSWQALSHNRYIIVCKSAFISWVPYGG